MAIYKKKKKENNINDQIIVIFDTKQNEPNEVDAAIITNICLQMKFNATHQRPRGRGLWIVAWWVVVPSLDRRGDNCDPVREKNKKEGGLLFFLSP